MPRYNTHEEYEGYAKGDSFDMNLAGGKTKVQIKDRMTMPCTAECTLIKLSNHIMFLYIYSR